MRYEIEYVFPYTERLAVLVGEAPQATVEEWRAIVAAAADNNDQEASFEAPGSYEKGAPPQPGWSGGDHLYAIRVKSITGGFERPADW